MSGSTIMAGRGIAAGVVEAEAVVAPVRISFWGGFDPTSGTIIEHEHPLSGVNVAGKILIFISTRGASGTSLMLRLAQRLGKAPVALVNTEIDDHAVLGCLVAGIPMVVIPDFSLLDRVRTGDRVRVDGERGTVEVLSRT